MVLMSGILISAGVFIQKKTLFVRWNISIIRKAFFITGVLVFSGCGMSAYAQKKKKTFWDKLNDGIDNVNNTINKGLGYKVYKGEWQRHGGGCWESSGNFRDHVAGSPLNQSFIAKVLFTGTAYGLSLTSNENTSFGYVVYDPYGKRVHTKISENKGALLTSEFTPQIKGDYTVIVFTARRFGDPFGDPLNDPGGKFTFSMQCEGLTPVITEKIYLENQEWGIKGGGGTGVTFNGLGVTDHTFHSPRNNRYKFKVAKGTVLHAIAEPYGVETYLALFDPYGNAMDRNSKEVLATAQADGVYELIVATRNEAENGRYNLLLAGNFLEKPVLQKVNSTDLSGQFTSAFQKVFTFDIKSSSYFDTYFVSNDKSCQLVIKDRSGNTILQAPNYYNRNTIKISQPSQITAALNCNHHSSGFYELAFFGNFELKKDNASPVEAVISEHTESSGEILKAEGRITLQQSNPDYSSITVVADEYETGQRAAEARPDNTGKYVLDLAPGKKYSVTVLSDGKYLASTENYDLTKAASVNLKPIEVIGSQDIGKKLTLNNIFFDTGSPILLRQSYAELKRVAAFLKSNPKLKIEIAGHTDSVGDDASNLTLSQNRANAVLYYLQDQLDDFSRLSAKGYGKSEPVAGNSAEEGRKQNRRVEFRITGI